MPSHIDNRYWHVFVPENPGLPRISSCLTQDEFTRILATPITENGWVFCFFGCELPLLPSCSGFVTPTGRTVTGHGIAATEEPVLGKSNFFKARPQVPSDRRMVET